MFGNTDLCIVQVSAVPKEAKRGRQNLLELALQ